MKFYSPCEKCGKKAFFVRKRKYSLVVPPYEIITQIDYCRECHKGMKRLAASIKAND